MVIGTRLLIRFVNYCQLDGRYHDIIPSLGPFAMICPTSASKNVRHSLYRVGRRRLMSCLYRFISRLERILYTPIISDNPICFQIKNSCHRLRDIILRDNSPIYFPIERIFFQDFPLSFLSVINTFYFVSYFNDII